MESNPELEFGPQRRGILKHQWNGLYRCDSEENDPSFGDRYSHLIPILFQKMRCVIAHRDLSGKCKGPITQDANNMETSTSVAIRLIEIFFYLRA